MRPAPAKPQLRPSTTNHSTKLKCRILFELFFWRIDLQKVPLYTCTGTKFLSNPTVYFDPIKYKTPGQSLFFFYLTTFTKPQVRQCFLFLFIFIRFFDTHFPHSHHHSWSISHAWHGLGGRYPEESLVVGLYSQCLK